MQKQTTHLSNLSLTTFMISSLLLSISACAPSGPSDQEQIEGIIKERLIDPDSVKFGTFVISGKGNRACIEYNSKNRFGGYVGTKIARFDKTGSQWYADDLDTTNYHCDAHGFQELDIIDATKDEAKKIMATALQNALNISDLDAFALSHGDTININGKTINCSSASRSFQGHTSSAASDAFFEKRYKYTKEPKSTPTYNYADISKYNDDSIYSEKSKFSRERAILLFDYFNKGLCPDISRYYTESIEEIKELVERKISAGKN